MTISKQLYADNARSTLINAINPTDTTLPVVDASMFPNITAAGQYFKVTLESNGVLEIVIVQGKSGNTLINCIRGSDNTSPSGYPSGTRVENRTTAATLAAFARLQDRFFDIASVDVLSPPILSDSNSYICHSNEDSGNPIIAIRNSDYTWRFSTHPTVLISSTVGSSTSGILTSNALTGFPSPVIVGQYIVQFTTGPAAGYCKLLISATGNTVSWGSSLAVQPLVGDHYEIYRSTSSSLSALASNSGDEGIIYSILLND
jgi:hypothetical protein